MELSDVIYRLTELSPTASNIFYKKLYLSHPEGEDIENILNRCLEGALSDLNSKGFFLEDVSTYSNIDLANVVISILTIFNQEFLDLLLKNHHEILDSVNNYNFDETEDATENLLEFINFLSRRFENNMSLNEFIELLEQLEFHCNSTFITYLKEIIDNIPYNDNSNIVGNIVFVSKLIEHVKQDRAIYKACIDRVISKLNTIDKDKLLTSAKYYDVDKVQPNVVARYATIMFDECVPDELRISMMKEHRRKNSHHIDYFYANRSIIIEDYNLVELVLHHISVDVTMDDQLKNIIKMFKEDRSDPNKNLLTNEHVELCKQVLLCLPMFEKLTKEELDDKFNSVTK